MKPFNYLILAVFILFISGCANKDWRTANRASSGIAAAPSVEKQAIIEFYAADAFSWRGWFAVHTWIAVKPQNADEYTVYEVTGWQVSRGLPALKQYQTKTPDRYWYGAKPEKILALTGDKAQTLIPKIESAVNRYPWADEYRLFPGPNSNTFPTWIGLQVPELKLEMPFRAIGSGFASE